MRALSISFGAVRKDVEARMRSDLAEYESSHGIDVNYERFSISLSEGGGNTLGVLHGYTAYAEIYVDDLWVDSFHRGRGFGSKLMQALEDKYSGEGFNNINLVTSAFQAPGFYRKCGFEEEFTRRNLQNPKLDKTFFVKFFENEEQTQGLLHD